MRHAYETIAAAGLILQITWVGQAAVDADVVRAKMAAMAEGARIASTQFST